MPRTVFTPCSFALTGIYHQNAFIPKCTLQTGCGRLWQGEIPQDDGVLLNVKLTLREVDTLVPMIFMSDGTHLSNFAGDKRERPVDITIGNITAKIRQMPSTHIVVNVALLPILNQNCNIPQKRLDEQRQTN